MSRYSTKPVKIIEGSYKGDGFEQQRSKRNPAAPGELYAQVALRNGMVVWVPARIVVSR